MRHLLMDPAFPDIVGEWAKQEAGKTAKQTCPANDNKELLELLRTLAARAEINATRAW